MEVCRVSLLICSQASFTVVPSSYLTCFPLAATGLASWRPFSSCLPVPDMRTPAKTGPNALRN